MNSFRIPHGWQPRGYQRDAWDYFENGGKRAVLVWHRRAGKDEIALHMTACRALEKPATYWHMLPEASQARKAIWDAVNPHTGRRRIDEAFPDEICDVKRQNEMFIRFRNGSTWQLVGSDNFNSLVGSPPAGVVFSEYALSNPTSWGIISPILRENGGWAAFISTPRGRNHLKSLYDFASGRDGWFAEKLTALDTKRFSAAELKDIEEEYVGDFGQDMGKSLFEQEYLCSWDAAVLGAYYGRAILDLEQRGQITEVPHEPTKQVWTAWDLGMDDSMSIWFVQVVGGQIRVIDCYQNRGQGMAHYVALVREKPYIYAGHITPHDVKVRELGTGKSRLEVMEDLGLKNVVVAPDHELLDGINAVRSFLPRCWFDEKATFTGINSLRMYRSEWDEKAKVLKPRPRHDEFSHYADAFRYLAMGLDQHIGLGLEKRAIDRYRRDRKTSDDGGWMAA